MIKSRLCEFCGRFYCLHSQPRASLKLRSQFFGFLKTLEINQENTQKLGPNNEILCFLLILNIYEIIGVSNLNNRWLSDDSVTFYIDPIFKYFFRRIILRGSWNHLCQINLNASFINLSLTFAFAAICQKIY